MNNLKKAADILNSSEYTCVMCSDNDILTSKKRGVSPLLELLDKGYDLHEYSAADKVVGNGAAFLYVLLKIKEVHAGVISKNACITLKNNNIPVTYDTLVGAIRNRDNTGFCPIEEAVAGITSPDDALVAIRNRLKNMM